MKNIFVFLCLISTVCSTTWVINAPHALFDLAGSASASASAPASYIADLRRKDNKAAELQEDKHLIGLKPLSNKDKNEEEGNNESLPSFLKKKIGKVLAKLRLVAQIKNAYHYKPEEHEHEMFTEAIQTTESIMKNTKKENIQQIANNSYWAAKNATKDQESDEKVSLKTNNKNAFNNNNINKQSEQIKEQEPNRFGNLGIFFAEIFGSIVGLTYGAFAQITSGTENPVTVSTSERV